MRWRPRWCRWTRRVTAAVVSLLAAAGLALGASAAQRASDARICSAVNGLGDAVVRIVHLSVPSLPPNPTPEQAAAAERASHFRALVVDEIERSRCMP